MIGNEFSWDPTIVCKFCGDRMVLVCFLKNSIEYVCLSCDKSFNHVNDKKDVAVNKKELAGVTGIDFSASQCDEDHLYYFCDSCVDRLSCGALLQNVTMNKIYANCDHRKDIGKKCHLSVSSSDKFDVVDESLEVV